MNKNLMVFGLLAVLLLATCAPAASGTPAGAVEEVGREDANVLVYASPL